MKKYMKPEIKISYFGFELVKTAENPTATPLTESSLTVGAQDVYQSVITGGTSTNAMQKSVKFQDAMGYK